MEQQDSKTNVPRKMRFAPKAPPRRAPKLEVKTEVTEDTDAQARDLLQRFRQATTKTKPKFEKKVAPAKVAFGHGGASASLKSFSFSKAASRSSRETSHGVFPSPGLIEEKEYQEPWDYYSYYPVTLPLRRPYSGNPEFLDEEEFASENITYDENSVEAAAELGLMEENLEPGMFFVQLPPTLPMIKQSGTTAGHEVATSSTPAAAVGSTCGLEELPAGLMGKMLVYKSGAVKLKLGDILYDVTPGLNCIFAQDLVAANTAEKRCCVVGELNKRAILTPNVDSVLNSLADL